MRKSLRKIGQALFPQKTEDTPQLPAHSNKSTDSLNQIVESFNDAKCLHHISPQQDGSLNATYIRPGAPTLFLNFRHAAGPNGNYQQLRMDATLKYHQDTEILITAENTRKDQTETVRLKQGEDPQIALEQLTERFEP